jgi:hypothetical protein
LRSCSRACSIARSSAFDGPGAGAGTVLTPGSIGIAAGVGDGDAGEVGDAYGELGDAAAGAGDAGEVGDGAAAGGVDRGVLGAGEYGDGALVGDDVGVIGEEAGLSDGGTGAGIPLSGRAGAIVGDVGCCATARDGTGGFEPLACGAGALLSSPLRFG